MNPLVIIGCFMLMAGMVVAEGVLAYRHGMFTAEQLLQRRKDGMPFSWDGAMWSDLLLVTPVVTALVAAYGEQWSLRYVWPYALGVLGINLVTHYFWTKGPIRRRLSGTGSLLPPVTCTSSIRVPDSWLSCCSISARPR